MFFAKVFGKKVKAANVSMKKLYVGFDPETASEVQIEEYENNYDLSLTDQVQLEEDYEREQKEADVATKNFEDKKAAAHMLIEEQDTNPDDAELNEAVEEILEELKELKADMEMEIQEAEEAKQDLDEAEDLADKMLAKLNQAKKRHGNAIKSMARNDRRLKRAGLDEERARKRAGLLKDDENDVDVFAIMESKANATGRKAEVAKRKAAALDGSSKGNDRVAAALAKVRGEDQKKVSAKDRLANL